MKNYAKQINDTTIRVGEGRFSYAYVWEPKKNEDGTQGKYSTCFLIPKTQKESLALCEKAIAAAAKAGAEKNWKGKIPANLKTPLRDGDEEHPDDPVYEGMMFFNCSNTKRPAVCVYDEDLGAASEALDEEEFYSGCWGAVIVTFYSYDKNGNRGVGASLGNVIKTRDDERLSGSNLSIDTSFGDM